MEETHLRTLIPRADKPIDLVEELRRSERRHTDCNIRMYCTAGGVTFGLQFDAHRVEESDQILQVDFGTISFDSASSGMGVRIDTSNPRFEVARYITFDTRLIWGGGTVERIVLTHTRLSRWACSSPGSRCSL